MRLRAITTGINPRLGPAEVASILERTEPRVVVRVDDLDERARRVHARARPAIFRTAGPTIRSRSCGRAARPARPRARCSTTTISPRSRSAPARWASAFDRRLVAVAVRARRVHVAAVGGDREGHHDGHPADAVDGGRDARADGGRARDGRPGRADAVAARARPSRLRRRPTSRRCASRERARRRSRPSSCARWNAGSDARS